MSLLKYATRIGKKEEGILERVVSKEQKYLIDTSRGIDRIDCILGPMGALMNIYGNDFWNGVGLALNLAEVFLIKAPYAKAYYNETKDKAAIALWTTKEIITNVIRPLGFFDVLATYYNRTRNKFENNYLRRQDENNYLNKQSF